MDKIKETPRFFTIMEAQDNLWDVAKGDKVAFLDPEGNISIGIIRFKKVKCGKPACKQCPHGMYAYAQYRRGQTMTEKYIGKL